MALHHIPLCVSLCFIFLPLLSVFPFCVPLKILKIYLLSLCFTPFFFSMGLPGHTQVLNLAQLGTLLGTIWGFYLLIFQNAAISSRTWVIIKESNLVVLQYHNDTQSREQLLQAESRLVQSLTDLVCLVFFTVFFLLSWCLASIVPYPQ